MKSLGNEYMSIHDILTEFRGKMSKQEHVQRKHMSRLTDLISKAKAIDPQLGTDMEREFRALSSRLSFGLNFRAA